MQSRIELLRFRQIKREEKRRGIRGCRVVRINEREHSNTLLDQKTTIEN